MTDQELLQFWEDHKDYCLPINFYENEAYLTLENLARLIDLKRKKVKLKPKEPTKEEIEQTRNYIISELEKRGLK